MDYKDDEYSGDVWRGWDVYDEDFFVNADIDVGYLDDVLKQTKSPVEILSEAEESDNYEQYLQNYSQDINATLI